VTAAPRFSVVIPAHNAARTLPATVSSVLTQTRQDFEVLVVDDGSVDGTEAALRSATADSRIHYVRQQQLGPAAARNAGIQRAGGSYVSFLDSDDLWLPHYLQTMLDALEADPGAGLAYTDAWRLDDATKRIYRRSAMASQAPPASPPREPDALLQALLEHNFVYTSVTVRRSVLDDVGGFRTLTRSEDYELWLRVAAHGQRFVRAPGLLAVYRDRPGSRIHDPGAMLRGRREIYQLVVDEYEVSPAARRRAEKRLVETERELAALERGGEDSHQKGRWPSALLGILGDRRHFYRSPPRPVAAAFPDLRSL
jgi:glycosyltransferase involved in cell wall biosynthesis